MFIGWGSAPYFSEFNAQGQLLFDAHMHGSYESYRAYRFAWTGAPAGAPAVAAVAGERDGAGDGLRELERRHPHRRLAACSRGPSPAALAPGRERPAQRLRDGDRDARRRPAYVAVQALDAAGNVLGTSPAIQG